jgi:hypothetical protein
MIYVKLIQFKKKKEEKQQYALLYLEVFHLIFFLNCYFSVIDLIDSDEDKISNKRKLNSNKTSSTAFSNFEQVYNAKSCSSTSSSKSSSSSSTSASISSDEENQREALIKEEQPKPVKSSVSSSVVSSASNTSFSSSTSAAYSFKFWNIKLTDCLPREDFVKQAQECDPSASECSRASLDDEENSQTRCDKNDCAYKAKFVSIGLFANGGQSEIAFNRLSGIDFTIRGWNLTK